MTDFTSKMDEDELEYIRMNQKSHNICDLVRLRLVELTPSLNFIYRLLTLACLEQTTIYIFRIFTQFILYNLITSLYHIYLSTHFHITISLIL